MLHRDDTHAFIKRWNDLERAERDLDFARSQWSAELFAMCKSGDEEFINWCTFNIGISEGSALELLERARAVATVPDEKTWNRVGGFQQVRQLANVPPEMHVPIIEAAKSTHRNIRAVLRERNLIEPQERSSPAKDAAALAAFIESLRITVPRNVSKIVSRYVVPSKRSAAA